MKMSAASLTVSETDIAADAAARPIGVAGIMPEGETADLDVMFIDPPAIGGGAGRLLFQAAAIRARQLGARRMTILADPHAGPFYERMGARFLRNAPSDAIPGRMLPLYEYDLMSEIR
jgi:GNAT superfamily N-acetyltransferase